VDWSSSHSHCDAGEHVLKSVVVGPWWSEGLQLLMERHSSRGGRAGVLRPLGRNWSTMVMSIRGMASILSSGDFGKDDLFRTSEGVIAPPVEAFGLTHGRSGSSKGQVDPALRKGRTSADHARVTAHVSSVSCPSRFEAQWLLGRVTTTSDR